MGSRGLWGKFTMYEESVAVPFIMAGPGVPLAKVSNDLVSLVDCYPTIVEALGLQLTQEEADLPGRSLWPIAQGHSYQRIAFSEYHAVGSTSASYMLREGRYKYIHYVDHRPQLFDLQADAQEINDLVDSAEHKSVQADFEQRLRTILDPDAVDAQAKADQAALIERHGGRQKVLERGTFINSPAPGEEPTFQSGLG